MSNFPGNGGHWYSIPANWVLGYLSQFDFFQHWSASTDYYRPWWNLERFYENSIFLPMINNEDPVQYHQEYKDRMVALKHFGMFMFD